MKKISIALVPMFLVVGACAPHVSGFGFEAGDLLAKKPCKPPPSMPDCQDHQFKNDVHLTITLNSAQVVVQPKTICVKRPGTVTVNINSAGAPGKNTVRTVPKDLADLWMFGDNGRDQYKFTLIVDETVELGDYYYGVATINAGCIDPRMTVDN